MIQRHSSQHLNWINTLVTSSWRIHQPDSNVPRLINDSWTLHCLCEAEILMKCSDTTVRHWMQPTYFLPLRSRISYSIRQHDWEMRVKSGQISALGTEGFEVLLHLLSGFSKVLKYARQQTGKKIEVKIQIWDYKALCSCRTAQLGGEKMSGNKE